VWQTIQSHTDILDADIKSLRELYPSQIGLLKARLGELEKKVADLKFFCHFYKEIVDTHKSI
jgi:hypothetical protein